MCVRVFLIVKKSRDEGECKKGIVVYRPIEKKNEKNMKQKWGVSNRERMNRQSV